MAAKDQFCLFLRRKRPRIERSESVPGGRASVFPLDQPEVPVFCTNGLQGAHALENLRFVHSIFVISDCVHIAEHPGLHGRLYPGKALFPVAGGASEDLCFRVCFPDRLCGVDAKFAVFLSVCSVFPAVIPVRFVPDLKHFYPPLIMPGKGAAIVCPSSFFPFGENGRTPYGPEIFFCGFRINGVTVTQAQPRLHAARNQIIHDLVQPCKIIDPFFFLGPHPSRLQTDILHTDIGEPVVCFTRIEHVSVQLFQSDAESCVFFIVFP